ncbi:hypothetical protein ACMFMG_001258 [Clarireedia jacksonii]
MAPALDHDSSTTDPTIVAKSLLSGSLLSGNAVRAASRSGRHCSPTSGLAPTYLQANLIVLPSEYAEDFVQLCKRNPVPCPLLAKSASLGSYDALESWIDGVADDEIAAGVDIRTDIPKYMVYEDGALKEDHCDDILQEWTKDHVAFLIGCSFSFETALTDAGLPPRHALQQRNVPMYKTNIPLCPAGIFTNGTFVVSMRPYKKADIEKVRAITRPYLATHGEPIAWGWDAVERLGIKDISRPDWGDPPSPISQETLQFGFSHGDEDHVPVFWGCGVTPQQAVISAGLKGVVMGHAPGHMLVLDCRDWDIVRGNRGNNLLLASEESARAVAAAQDDDSTMVLEDPSR